MGLFSRFRTLAARRSRLLRRPWRCTPEQAADRKWLGDTGEKIAALHIEARGGSILYRNFRPDEKGELDLVVRDGKILCFVEVKTRTAGGAGNPADAVTLTKQQLIIRGARAWLRLLGNPEIPWRFDVVEVVLAEQEPPRVNWMRGAFSAEEALQRSARRRQ